VATARAPARGTRPPPATRELQNAGQRGAGGARHGGGRQKESRPRWTRSRLWLRFLRDPKCCDDRRPTPTATRSDQCVDTNLYSIRQPDYLLSGSMHRAQLKLRVANQLRWLATSRARVVEHSDSHLKTEQSAARPPIERPTRPQCGADARCSRLPQAPSRNHKKDPKISMTKAEAQSNFVAQASPKLVCLPSDFSRI
jgi:hypothetical protein